MKSEKKIMLVFKYIVAFLRRKMEFFFKLVVRGSPAYWMHKTMRPREGHPRDEPMGQWALMGLKGLLWLMLLSLMEVLILV